MKIIKDQTIVFKYPNEMFVQGYWIPILCASCIWVKNDHEEKHMSDKMGNLVIQLGKYSVFLFFFMSFFTADALCFIPHLSIHLSSKLCFGQKLKLSPLPISAT